MGHHPVTVNLETDMVYVGVSFSMLMYCNECVMRPKAYWKSNLLLSWT